jgi:hypothetical protein
LVYPSLFLHRRRGNAEGREKTLLLNRSAAYSTKTWETIN